MDIGPQAREATASPAAARFASGRCPALTVRWTADVMCGSAGRLSIECIREAARRVPAAGRFSGPLSIQLMGNGVTESGSRAPVFVVGGAGFIGSALVSQLLAA